LSSHKEKAFTEGEIVAALPVRNETLFIGALQKLLELGVVSARKVGEYSYYALGERKLQEYLEGQEPRRPTTPF
jgi:DNA-binding transcriptional ArsR family regulator